MSAVHHLRAHVLQGAAHRHHHMVFRLSQPLCQPKVNYPEIVVVVWVGKHDVEGLEVEVEDALAVDELDSPHNLSDEDLTFPLCQAVVVGGRSGDHVLIVQGRRRVPGDEVPPSEVLGHQDRVERGLVEANQLHHEGRLDQRSEHLGLAAHFLFLLC